jgi:hypothetical protein
VTRAPLLLLLAGLALAPLSARAGTATDPNAIPNPLLQAQGTTPCFPDANHASDTIAGLTVWADPNEPNTFGANPGCTSTCKKAAASCARFVKRAAQCQMHFESDTATFKTKTGCLAAVDAKECAAALKTARDDAIAAIKTKETADLAACQGDAALKVCTDKCNGS